MTLFDMATLVPRIPPYAEPRRNMGPGHNVSFTITVADSGYSSNFPSGSFDLPPETPSQLPVSVVQSNPVKYTSGYGPQSSPGLPPYGHFLASLPSPSTRIPMSDISLDAIAMADPHQSYPPVPMNSTPRQKQWQTKGGVAGSAP